MYREVVTPFVSSGWAKAIVAAAIVLGLLQWAQGQMGGLGIFLCGLAVLPRLRANQPVVYSFDDQRVTLEGKHGRLEIARDAILEMRRCGLKNRGTGDFFAVRLPVIEVRYRTDQGEAITYFSPSGKWWEHWVSSGGAPLDAGEGRGGP